MAYHIDKPSLVKRNNIFYVELQGRHFDFDTITTLDSNITKEQVVNAMNKLGNSDDTYRMSITMGYQLKF